MRDAIINIIRRECERAREATNRGLCAGLPTVTLDLGHVERLLMLLDRATEVSGWPAYRSRKRGCPSCEGVDPSTCARCGGATRLCDWVMSPLGWVDPRDHDEQEGADEMRRALNDE